VDKGIEISYGFTNPFTTEREVLMAHKTKVQKSIPEQILDDFITRIYQQEEFDQQVIKEIERLIQEGNLKRPQQVKSVIEAKPGG
jgi:hypothetical protein